MGHLVVAEVQRLHFRANLCKYGPLKGVYHYRLQVCQDSHCFPRRSSEVRGRAPGEVAFCLYQPHSFYLSVIYKCYHFVSERRETLP